ncbi:hypothetical protein EVA_10229 [gut metagenome]|uniref:Uncharacterized protein n=1 Tax=gut metagenome TaxID=749906 RepID=J9CNI0_9ZZZZ
MFESSFSFYKPPNQKVMVRVLLNLHNSIVRLQSPFPKSRNRIAGVQCNFPNINPLAELNQWFYRN